MTLVGGSIWRQSPRQSQPPPPEEAPLREHPILAAVTSAHPDGLDAALLLPLREPPHPRAPTHPDLRLLNQGHATEEMVDELFAAGIRHVLLHTGDYTPEDSPFPGTATLRALTGHRRLAGWTDDGQVFAFRILPAHPVGNVPQPNWREDLYATRQHWQWDPPLDISRDSSFPLPLSSPLASAPQRRYLLKLAPGSTRPLVIPPGRQGTASLTHPIPGLPEWVQAELPHPTGGRIHAVSGPVTLERALVTAGDLPAPGPDGVIHIAPALLFHAGRTSPGSPAVRFDPELVPAGRALQGPNLPLPPSVYDITLSYAVRDRTNGPAGIFRVATFPDGVTLAEALLDPATNTLVLRALRLNDAPITFEFDYSGTTAVLLREIRLAPATIRLQPVKLD